MGSENVPPPPPPPPVPEDALMFIDGVEVPTSRLKELSADDIETINVWKGDAAVERFGERGRNGVVEVQTKSADQGAVSPSMESGEVRFRVRGNRTMDPIFVVDGQVVTKAEMEELTPDGIAEVVVHKVTGDAQNDDQLIEAYGDGAANGVVVITTNENADQAIITAGDAVMITTSAGAASIGENGDPLYIIDG